MKTRLTRFAMVLVASAISDAKADAIDVDSALRSIIANNPAVQAEIYRRLTNGGTLPNGVTLGEVVFRGNLSGRIRYTAPTGLLPLSPAVEDATTIFNCSDTPEQEEIALGSSVSSSYRWENSRAITSRNGLMEIATTLIHPATGAVFDSKTTTTNATFSYGTTETKDLRRTTKVTIPAWKKTYVQLQYSVGSTEGMAYVADFKYSGKTEVAFVREGQIEGAQIHRDPYYCLTATPPLAGNMVLVVACNKAERFKFDNTEGAIYRKSFGCLTGPGLPNKPVHMEDCNGRNDNQRWRRNIDGTISGSPNNRLCLTASGQSGVLVQECSPNAEGQKWKIDAYEVARGGIDLESVIPDDEKRKISITGVFTGTVANYNSEIRTIDSPLTPTSPDCHAASSQNTNVRRGKSPHSMIRMATPDEVKVAKPIR